MRPAIIALLLCVGVMLLSVTRASPRSPQAASAISVTVYDEHPSHIWNRLYAALRVREDTANRYGEDSLDPMLWEQSEHLLAQPSHGSAVEVLDEFLRSHAESLIHDPLKRAMLQHDLWAVFDWSVQQVSWRGQQRVEYGKEKRDLQIRLAEVLRSLALTQEQIRALPDNYARGVASGAFPLNYDLKRPQQPFLPPDLFDPRGPWVCITPSPDPIGYGGVAKLHFTNISGRSVFLVFVRLPEGRRATLDYFQTLWNFPQPWVSFGPPGDEQQTQPNPALPSFPAGTQVALARQMMLFDNHGELMVSPIIESVQIRVYREITRTPARAAGGASSGQDFFEFTISRPLLFSARQGGLRPTTPGDKEPPTFQTHGFDLIDESSGQEATHSRFGPTLQRCVACHSGGGISSFNSLDRLLKPMRRQEEPRAIDYGPRFWSESEAISWKEDRFDWGLLNGYWKTTSN